MIFLCIVISFEYLLDPAELNYSEPASIFPGLGPLNVAYNTVPVNSTGPESSERAALFFDSL